MPDDDTLTWATAAAIRNHLSIKHDVTLSLQQIQEMLSEWPAPELPPSVIQDAMNLLEEMEVVSRNEEKEGPRWRGIGISER